MTHRIKRLCAAVPAFAAVAALAALSLAAPLAQAAASASASITNLHIQLIDLDTTDGITPGIDLMAGPSPFSRMDVMALAENKSESAYRELVPGTAFGPLTVTRPATFATVTMLAGDYLGASAGPGLSAASGASGEGSIAYGIGDVLPLNFTLTGNTRMVITATVDTSAQASLGDWASAFARLAGSDMANHDFAFTYAQSSVSINGNQVIDPTTSLQISFDNVGANAYSGFLRTSASAYSNSATAVPEPQSVALMLAGLAVLGAAAKRRRLPSR